MCVSVCVLLNLDEIEAELYVFAFVFGAFGFELDLDCGSLFQRKLRVLVLNWLVSG